MLLSTFEIRAKKIKGKGTVKSGGKVPKVKKYNLDLSDDEEFENASPDGLANELAGYTKEMQGIEDSLKTSLSSCKCRKNRYCIIDRHSNHYNVTAMMLRSWVLALVSIRLFLNYFALTLHRP